MRSTDPTVRTEPVDDTVTMAVDYAEQDHQQLRRQGTPAAATGPDRTNDPASVVTRGVASGVKWARRDSNPWPIACKAIALTN